MAVKKILFRGAAQLALSILHTIDEISYGQGAHSGQEENRKNPQPWLKKLRVKDCRFSSDMRNSQLIVNILRAAADGQKIKYLLIRRC
jgi:hypothetical protein